jgi:hypothetical protein
MPTLTLSKILRRRAGLYALLLAPAALATFPACTDLTETPQDALSPNNTFRTNNEIQAGLTAVYAQARGGTAWSVYNLSEVTTDEQVVPTRGSDWYDNGRWLEIHRQTWSANSGSALDDMNGMWNDLFTGVSRANLVINAVQTNGVAGQERAVAEARVLRAWFYFLLQDAFGGVPIVTETDIKARARNTRAEVFAFIEKELNESRPALIATRPLAGDANYGRVNQSVVDAILASLYLNAEVYTGTVTQAGLQRGPAQWQKAIEAANKVINSGFYSLASSPAQWRSNFSVTNETSPENIFVSVHVAQPGLGQTLPMRVLHYNQLDPAPWNGWAVTAEAYAKFDTIADTRSSVFLSGPQVSFVNNAPVNDRAGRRLVYTREIGNVEAATEAEGVRLVKFPPLVGAPDGQHPNDYPFFRLAEMYMIRAEANFRLGNTAAALADLNTLRARVFTTPKPLTAVTEDAILNERLFEFVGEGKRRRDLIRFGRFTAARQYKPATEPFKILFPIPVTQLATNPLLQQNPGY